MNWVREVVAGEVYWLHRLCRACIGPSVCRRSHVRSVTASIKGITFKFGACVIPDRNVSRAIDFMVIFWYLHPLTWSCVQVLGISNSEPKFYYRHVILGLIIPDIYIHNRVLSFFRCQKWAKQIWGMIQLVDCSAHDLEIWCMTSKNKWTPFPYHVKLSASYQSHQWIQTWVTVRKRSIRVKTGDFVPVLPWNFFGWPWEIIRHLLYTTPSFVHHFEAIGEFKLELYFGNARFLSKSAFFCPVWPWDLTDDLENNRAHLVCCCKLCASFCSHWRIQTGVTVRKRPSWV